MITSLQTQTLPSSSPTRRTTISLTIELADADDLIVELVERIGDAKRFLLGVTGPPGAGKSMFAARIAGLAPAAVGCVVAPMDGFHRDNAELAALGLLELKGVPATFDAESFVDHLRRLRKSTAAVPWPTYDRAREEVVPGGTQISPEQRLVVVEGNYLLLEEPPWDKVRPLLDEVWYLDVPVEVLEPRLLARQARDRDAAGARRKVDSTDLPNARLIAATKQRADVVIADRPRF